jgi:cell division protein ZipA
MKRCAWPQCSERMTTELRLILMALSLVLLVGIWWWGARKSTQAPGKSELREPSMSEPQRREALIETTVDIDATPVASGPVASARDWGVPPFEPLSIRTAEYDRVPVLDGPMMVQADALPAVKSMPAMKPLRVHEPLPSASPIDSTPPTIGVTIPTTSATPAAAAAHASLLTPTPSVTPVVPPAPAPAPATAPPPAPAKSATVTRVPTLSPENSDRIAVASARIPNSAELQKIISIRVSAPGETRWPGAALLAALESHGLAYGRYQVFHRKHVDGRSLFCVASLVEPGSFDVANMAADEFRGVTLFAVLPGPVEPLLTIDELLSAARGLAQDLTGMLQDAKGVPLSPQRAAALRDDVARFQASLPPS